MQAPMLSSPLKQTNEIDWISPLKHHIRTAYGDDPERYTEECATLNRLRQDMRGASKDSAGGRDLLMRYYFQLELLDLRFPVDENHIKISFTWFDAFTHKPASQYSLAFEKASIMFNISAVLSCHAANQNRHEDTGLKTAYHSFQASAGMFEYINDNFLHAPSMDLSRETVKTLVNIMLAQGQEVFIEKQITDGKKSGLLAKLAAQAAYLFAQAVEGVQENVSKAVFERVWLLVTQIKQHHMASVAQYYQAVADYEANNYGQSIARLTAAQTASKEAHRIANTVPSSMPSNSNLGSDTGPTLVDTTKKHMTMVQEKLVEYTRDNDMIYHQPVPAESSLPSIPKLPAAKPILIFDLWQGQDTARIRGPDIFQRIVPMSVTEGASLYDEEKAKLIRAEGERCQTADDELATSLDYLKLPGSLNILKGMDQGSMNVDSEFRKWCAELASHDPFTPTFDQLRESKQRMLTILETSMKQLDMEESVCEKMRSKYGVDWTQQPSSRLTSTLRTDAQSYRSAVEEASTSDAQLYSTFRQHESDFDEMRSAGETEEADVLYQRAMIKAGAGKKSISGAGTQNETDLLGDDFQDESRNSVAELIERVEELMRKLQLIKRERAATLKDLKEKVHTDDISSVLILNKQAITTQDAQLFKQELEKFRPYQTRILQANHKQASLMRELTKVFSDLLRDKRVRNEQNKFEAFSKQVSTVLSRYRKVYSAFCDLQAGLLRAQEFYTDMRDIVDSLKTNVDSFVQNRRSEGAQLLSSIEAARGAGAGADKEQARLKELMERMSVSSPSSSTQSPVVGAGYAAQRPSPAQPQVNYAQQQPVYSPGRGSMPFQQTNATPAMQYASYGQPTAQPQFGHDRQTSITYNPNAYGPVSPPPHQQFFSPPPNQQYQSPTKYNQIPQQSYAQQVPPGWQPPPPPPGPPPTQDYSSISAMQGGAYPSGAGGYAQNDPRKAGQSGQADPWAGLSSWK